MAQKKKSVGKSKPKTASKVKTKAKSASKKAAPSAKKAIAKSKTSSAKPGSTPVAKKLKPSKSASALSHFQPLDDRILVEKLEESDRTPGGLFIPDSAKERPMKGRVVAVGRGHLSKKGRLRPLDVKVGDVVLFAKWSGGEVDLASEKSRTENNLVIMRESDLLGIVAET